MWHLTKLALRSRVLTLAIAFILAGVSVWALLGLKVELIPNIEVPYISVVTIYPNATPDSVVQDVTVPIEKIVWDRWHGHGLKHVTSTSSSGMSLVMGEFEYGTDMTSVNNSISEGLKQISFPAAVAEFAKASGANSSNPQIIPINMSTMPLVNLSLNGNLPASQLKQIAETRIVPELKKIDGVLRVDVEGGQPNQVIVSPDPDLMNKYGISIAQISALLPSTNVSLDEVAVTSLGTGNVKLSDVAQITSGLPPLSSITRVNGQPSIGIAITKTEKGNTVDVAQAIQQKVKSIQGTLGDDVQITTVYDQSQYITTSISQLWEKAIIGALLAIAVVFLFLWAIRASLITAISIPLSIFLAFLGMRATGLTINLLTLSALSIAVGRLIDDSIVMVEVIFRRRQHGENFKDAAIGGAKEVANPITTATLATVAIFIPLMFVGGIVGEMFVPFALTITFAMIASLLVALLVVPALSKLLVSDRARIKENRDNWYQKIYARALGWTLTHRVMVISATVIIFFGSVGLLGIIGTSFMSGMGDKILTVEIQLPVQSDINTTGATAAKVEALLTGNKAVKSYTTSIGSGTSMQNIMAASLGGGGSNNATIDIYLEPNADLKIETENLKQACLAIAGTDVINVSQSESGGGGMSMGSSGVNLSIQGDNQDKVSLVTNQLMERLKNVNGLSNLAADLTTVIPKLNIAIAPGKIAASGLSPVQTAQMQQEFYYLMVGGTLPGKTATIGNEQQYIYISSIAQKLSSVEQAQQLKIGYPNPVSLNDIASISIQNLPSHIGHTDTVLSANIAGTITAKNVGAVNQAIQKEIDALPPHPDVKIAAAGIAEQMASSLSSMGIAIIVAIFIVFFVVILMMRSIRNPLIIMVSLPLAAIGAFVALAITGYTLSVSAMMGLLMLIGIVLTNAVVLVSLVEYLRKSGMNTRDALIQGGKTRLRPILMTAFSTIFAMVPMTIGLSSGVMLTAELAVVVIGGLFSSTLLTLFVIPAIYSLAYRKHSITKPN